MRGRLFALAVLASAPLWAAKPIAKWDVVPYQRIKNTFNAGVVAFHSSALKVEFSVNGKSAFVAAEPTLNPQTKVKEYVFPFDASKRKDGPVRLSAKAVAGDGELELPEIVLYVDQEGTMGSHTTVWVDGANGNDFSEGSEDRPLKTIKQALAKAGDGGTIYLMASGDYRVDRMGGGGDRKFWTTICAAPGVKMKDVRIKGGRTGTDKLRFKDVQVFCDVEKGQGYVLGGVDANSSCWLDNCIVSNLRKRHAAYTYTFGNKLAGYVTGGATFDMGTGPCCRIVRNHRMKMLSADPFTASDTLAVNCQVEDVHASKDSDEPAFHRSQAVFGGWTEGVILYNVKGRDCWCNGLVGVKLRDSAFVDVEIETLGDRFRSRYAGEMDNVIFRNVQIKGQEMEWFKSVNGVGDFSPSGVTVVNCSFDLPKKEE